MKQIWNPEKEDFTGDNAASSMPDIPVRERCFKW
jgi:hypothetical protein